MLYDLGSTPFRCGILTDSFDVKLIKELVPSRPRQLGRRSYRNEVLLSRFRMSVIPTREWATKVGLSESSLCRHCSIALETGDHLLQCPTLALRETLPHTILDLLATTLKLRDRGNENAILHYCAHNDLFRLGGVPVPISDPTLDPTSGPTPSSAPKRQLIISPPPSPKRQRRHGVKRPASSDLRHSSRRRSK